MKVEELVPDIELCKLIPKGEFEDTELLRCTIDIDYNFFVFRHSEFYKKYKDVMSFVKAPTLEEIMAELPSCVCYRMNKEWSVGLVNDSAENAIKDSSGAAAALKLWLELKGIEYGK